jgi:hypothetical protein
MVLEPVFNGPLSRRPEPVSIGISEIRFKAPFVIRAHMVSVVAVETLPVWNPFREAMKGRVSGTVAGNGAILAHIEAVVPVEDVTGSTPGGSIKPPPAGTPIIKMAAETPPPQKVVHQVVGRFRVNKRVRYRQGGEPPSQAVQGRVRWGLCPPEIAGLVDHACQGAVEGADDPIDFLSMAWQTETGPLIRGRGIADDLAMSGQSPLGPLPLPHMTGSALKGVVFACGLDPLVAFEAVGEILCPRRRRSIAGGKG